MAEKKYGLAAKSYDGAQALGRSGVFAIKAHAAYTLAGQPDQADARIQQWLKQAPDDRTARLFLADASLKTNNFKQAIEQYEWIRQRQSDNVLVLNNLAWAYQQVKDPRALEVAEQAYKLKPDNAAVVDTFGWLLVEKGDVARGTPMLQKAVELAPKAQEIRYHLAQAWVRSGDKAKAIGELERILTSGVKFPQEADATRLLKSLRN